MKTQVTLLRSCCVSFIKGNKYTLDLSVAAIMFRPCVGLWWHAHHLGNISSIIFEKDQWFYG